ncbi:hypothetical protein DFH11DRAFT_14001 [Phellopilus nigrolimitatus]|nr:hypothetical protein DFH11DRAFT_14001 [Phellopilus nigrolimitatus]
MSADGSLDEAVLASLYHVQIVNYVNVLSMALVSYDFLLTFADEARLVWPTKWTVGKVLFFLTRYLVFIDGTFNLVELLQPSMALNACKPLYNFVTWMSTIGIAIAEIIMMMLVYAVWNKRRDVLIFLIALNLGILIPVVILMDRTLRSTVFIPSPFPTMVPCVVASADLSAVNVFLMIMASESVVIVMTLWKCYSIWRASKSTLMKAILESGLLYFVCLFAISLANYLVIKIANIDYSALLLELQRVLHSILTARMLLNIRMVIEPEGDGSDTSDIRMRTTTTDEDIRLEEHNVQSSIAS